MVHPPLPSAPSPPNPQLTLQFLSSALSQRGPSALPYSEDTKWLIRQHLLSLASTYPSLQPKTAIFTHNDGRSVHLLQADGTVPMSFQGVTYNIPIIIWLIDSYPRHSPTVYVNPTRDMIIKRSHPHVNPSGIVSINYLQKWIYPSSNLVELVRHLSIMFGRDPPLYSQRRPNPTNSASSPDRFQPQTDDPNEVYKRNAIDKLVENAHSDIEGLRKRGEAEMEGVFSAQGALRVREEQLRNGLKEMQEEKEALEQQLQMIVMNTDVVDAWLRENKGKILDPGNWKVEDAFNCVDVSSKQILECTASDMAVEDMIYSLEKAVEVGSIPFDQYLRNVRFLSREQFFQRATAAKVRAAQIQCQVANVGSRISYYVSS